MARRYVLSRGAWLPLLVSLAGHGVFLGLLALVPTSAETSTAVPVATCVLSLDADGEVRSATLIAPVGAPGEEESEFQPRLADASPVASSSAAEPSPVVLGQPKPEETGGTGTVPQLGGVGASPAGLGTGTGGGRPAIFGAVRPGQRVVYLVDRSMSMGLHHALDRARHELLACLAQLPATAKFQIVAYNRAAEPLYFGNRLDWLEASPTTLARATSVLMALTPTGGTDQGSALRRALSLGPDVIYLVTDGGDITPEDVQAVSRLNRQQAVINATELNGRRTTRADEPLRRLAAANGGTYRHIDLSER